MTKQHDPTGQTQSYVYMGLGAASATAVGPTATSAADGCGAGSGNGAAVVVGCVGCCTLALLAAGRAGVDMTEVDVVD